MSCNVLGEKKRKQVANLIQQEVSRAYTRGGWGADTVIAYVVGDADHYYRVNRKKKIVARIPIPIRGGFKIYPGGGP